MAFCPNCGKETNDDVKFCPNCGAPLGEKKQDNNISDDLKNMTEVPAGTVCSPKSRAVAAILCFFFGGIGVHQFYLGKTVSGVLMLIFCWTGIPSIIALIQFIIILLGSATDKEGLPVKKW